MQGTTQWPVPRASFLPHACTPDLELKKLATVIEHRQKLQQKEPTFSSKRWGQPGKTEKAEWIVQTCTLTWQYWGSQQSHQGGIRKGQVWSQEFHPCRPVRSLPAPMVSAETIQGAWTSTPHLVVIRRPRPTHWGGIREGLVQTKHFHHHPPVTRPPPQQNQWEPGGELELLSPHTVTKSRPPPQVSTEANGKPELLSHLAEMKQCTTPFPARAVWQKASQNRFKSIQSLIINTKMSTYQ